MISSLMVALGPERFPLAPAFPFRNFILSQNAPFVNIFLLFFDIFLLSIKKELQLQLFLLS
ncbi:MAG: hypothetical protein IJC68_00450, partial [Firmicutes bacterium]|nr:hypothetical protein [Bacillota bacterium]